MLRTGLKVTLLLLRSSCTVLAPPPPRPAAGSTAGRAARPLAPLAVAARHHHHGTLGHIRHELVHLLPAIGDNRESQDGFGQSRRLSISKSSLSKMPCTRIQSFKFVVVYCSPCFTPVFIMSPADLWSPHISPTFLLKRFVAYLHLLLVHLNNRQILNQ